MRNDLSGVDARNQRCATSGSVGSATIELGGQSRTMSLAEALTNVVVGYGIAVLTQILVFPALGLHVSIGGSFVIGGVFTLVSIARSYALRRLFERLRSRRSREARAVRVGKEGRPWDRRRPARSHDVG